MKNKFTAVMIFITVVISGMAACTQQHDSAERSVNQLEPAPNSNSSVDSAGIYGQMLDTVMSSADHTAPGM